MKPALIRLFSILALPLCLLLYFSFVVERPEDPFAPVMLPTRPPERIISFAPSITEILYELGQGTRIVGVTQFCKFPPEAAEKSRVGGHVDYNYEMLLRLRPDFVIILKEQEELAAFLRTRSIRHAAVGSDSVEEILASIQLIARGCFVRQKGEALAQNLRQVMADTLALPPLENRPNVLLCVYRDELGSGAVSKCVAAGASSFYNQLIEAAGGVNVLRDTRQAYPSIGAEAIIRLDPDIIIDISAAYSKDPKPAICGDWSAFTGVLAVQTESVHCLFGDYLTIPGPRFVRILDDFRNIFSKYAQDRS
jgi:iron complex transport system substrate-binding protein